MRQDIKSSAVPITPTDRPDCLGQDAELQCLYNLLLSGPFKFSDDLQVRFWSLFEPTKCSNSNQ